MSQSRTNYLALPILVSAVFLATASIGIWAAYDRTVAWSRFSLLAAGIVFVVVMLWESRHARERIAALLVWAGAGLAAALGVLYVVSHIQQLSIIHPNVAGGALAVTIPLAVTGTHHAWTRRSYSLAVVLGAGVCIAGVALLLTSSRGAWIGVAVGVGVAALAGQRALSRWQSYGAVAGLATILLTGFLVATHVPIVEQQLQIIGADGSTLGRIRLWRDMLYLIQDYPLTGSGLGMTAMVYSSYVLLLHVPFLYHAHNLFLQIAVEQGIVGLVAFIGMAAVALDTLLRMPVVSEQQRTYRAASIVSLTAVLVHGMFDAGLYVSMLAPLVFLPIGSAFLYAWDHSDAAARRMPAYVGGTLAALIVIALLLPSTRAIVHANLGTAAQTRAELAVYAWPAWPVQDAVRREIDLSTAIRHYETALALDETNAVAHRRLGQIDLSLGQYESAGRHLNNAAANMPDHRATQQMLGEYQAISGDVDGAVSLWQNIDTGHGQLKLRRWWYNEIDLGQQLPYVDAAIARIDR